MIISQPIVTPLPFFCHQQAPIFYRSKPFALVISSSNVVNTLNEVTNKKVSHWHRY